MTTTPPSTELTLLSETVFQTALPGLLVLTSTQHPDERGFYAELVKIPKLQPFLDQPFAPIQINHSHSKQNVIRGFHAENWNKLVTVILGECFSVFVDVRPDSPTFGQKISFTLGTSGAARYGCVFIPKGIANSTLALSPTVEYLYFVDQLYEDRDTSGDVSISLFDPDIAAEWPVDREQLILSERDTQAVSLRERFPAAAQAMTKQ